MIRELPVRFDAGDTAKARELGLRIGAEAVIIYRVDESPHDGTQTYIAYVVFTDPDVGLIIGAPSGADGLASSIGSQPSVQVKEGVAVPVLKTETLSELVNAAAGIIDYNRHRLRESIKHLELAVPPQADAPNTGIVQFYLGNAHNLDGDAIAAAGALESSATFYEHRIGSGEIIGPQDELILLKTYIELGRIASLNGEWDRALVWYEKGLPIREDLVARAAGLERPSDVPATYARLYTLMADVYRGKDQPEDQLFWQRRANEELDSMAAGEAGDDAYALTQEGVSRFFLGDCARASEAMTLAVALDPENIGASIDAGIIAFSQGRPDLALQAWQQVLEVHPDNVNALILMANLMLQQGISEEFFEESYLLQAEELYREVIRLDPTNLTAYDTIASINRLRAQGATIDSTALTIGDEMNVQKSQAMWPHDPVRQSETLDAYGEVVNVRRIVGSELLPGDPISQAAAANAYVDRQGFLYKLLLDQAVAEAESSASAPSATPQVDGTPLHLNWVTMNPGGSNYCLMRRGSKTGQLWYWPTQMPPGWPDCKHERLASCLFSVFGHCTPSSRPILLRS